VGNTSGGNHAQLDVGSDEQTLTRIFFDSVNGKCNLDYGSTIGGLTLSGSIPINPDGTFSATFEGSSTQNGQPDSETGSLQGRFTGASAAGSVTLNTDFYTEDGLHLTCSGTETWTAVLTP
jgi:hypothetical protein